ncbi:MAG TPA: hypothetical protein VJV23_12285 [Candidatus Polarisedimenticolia bacterium]|nr:hypothetical protein [Candidatus Polarisedimenticolia bacterium]
MTDALDARVRHLAFEFLRSILPWAEALRPNRELVEERCALFRKAG